jgi:membrane protein
VPGSDAGAISGYSSARRLWPRSIVHPPLTAADKSYYTAALRAEAQRPEQQLDIA